VLLCFFFKPGDFLKSPGLKKGSSSCKKAAVLLYLYSILYDKIEYKYNSTAERNTGFNNWTAAIEYIYSQLDPKEQEPTKVRRFAYWSLKNCCNTTMMFLKSCTVSR
jgi:hypothetical protein